LKLIRPTRAFRLAFTRLLVASIIISLLNGCGSQTPPVEEPASSQPDSGNVEAETPNAAAETEPVPDAIGIDVNLGAPPLTLDPSLVSPLDLSANDLVDNLFLGLTQVNPETRSIELALAREWQISEDGRTWTVFLREDVSWIKANGTEVQAVRAVMAQDVVAAVVRGCRSDVPSPNVLRLYVIEGCREVNRLPGDQITPEAIEQTLKTRVLNDFAVEFVLTEDYGAFPALLASPIMRPVPLDLITEQGENWTQPGILWSNGPYALSTGSDTVDVTLVRNTAFVDASAAGNVTEVRVRFDASGEAYSQWEAGELDFTAIPNDLAASMQGEGNPNLKLLALPVTAFITINHESPIINQAEVKAALSRGIDREAVVRDVVLPTGQPAIAAYVPDPPGSAESIPYEETIVPFDAGTAREAINNAGLRDCLGLPDRTFATDNSALSTALAEHYVADWSGNLGCRTEGLEILPIMQRELLVILTRLPVGLEQPRPGIAAFYWQGESPDAQHWYADIFGCRDPLFREAYLVSERECSQADEILYQLYQEDNLELRSQLQRQVTGLFFDPVSGEFPVIPIFHYARGVAIRDGIATGTLVGGSIRFDRWRVSE